MFAARQGYQQPVIRSARTATLGNSPIISTAQSQFGGSSFEGNNSRFVKMLPEFVVGSSDFTIECWVRFKETTSSRLLLSPYTTVGNVLSWAFFVGATGTLQYFLSSNGSTWNLASAVTLATFSINTWYHVALVRNGSTFTPYKDGVAGTTTTSAAALHNPSTPGIWIMGNDNFKANAFIDELRISNIARYTSGFTPATEPFIDDLNTILLMHFDGPNNSRNFLDDNT